jgi:TalC/MipB family fructose-6-phosphate aldolase
MKLFIDSAEREHLEPLLKTGLFAGVTTNPTLLARAGVKLKELPELVTWVRANGAETVFVQAWGVTVEDYLTCAAELVDACGDVVVKVPATPAGVAAVRSLETRGIHTLLTAVYNHVQVVPAIIAGATYLAPYLGRMNDAGLDGVAEIAQMQTVIDKAHSAARLLVASIRTPDQLARLAMCGVQDFTIAPKLWWELLSEPLTDAAVGVFEADATVLMS